MRRVGLGFLLGLVAQALLLALLAPICERSLKGFSLLAPICEGNLEGPVLLGLLLPLVAQALLPVLLGLLFSSRPGRWSPVADILSA
jgi:hypothetical protein